MIQTISKALNRFPGVKLETFQWSESTDPNMKVGNSARGAAKANNRGVVGYSNVASKDTGYLFYQIALVEGSLQPFDGDFREAIKTINDFADNLKNEESVHDVSIVSLPLDVSSNANLAGNTTIVKREAKFSLRIVLGIADAS